MGGTPPGMGGPPPSMMPMGPPPMQPLMDPMTGQPVMQTVQVPIHEEFYATRISPGKLLLDELLKSTRHDKLSRWIGHEFFVSKRQATRDWGLDPGLLQGSAEDDRVYQHDEDVTAHETSKSQDMVHGYEIFYKCAFFRDDAYHPEAIDHLILIDNLKEETVVCRPSPDQTFDEQGKLTDDSLVGFPIKVGVIRDLADSPYPPADAAFTNAQVKALNTSRQQSLQLRDAAVGKFLYDTGAIDDEDLQRIRDGRVGDFIGVKDGILAGGADRVIVPMTQVKATQDDYHGSQIIKQDMDETLGISASQAGSPLSTVRSATEVAEFSQSSAGRVEKEQSRVIQFYLSIVKALDTLIVRYARGENYVSVVGEDGARSIMMWNKQLISGRYSYDIKPDSQLRVDTKMDRQQKMNFYNLAAKDPLFNRAIVLRDIGRDFGYDPSKVVATPAMQMMQPPPEAPAGGPMDKHQSERSGGKPNAPGSQGQGREARNPALGPPPPGPPPGRPQ